MKQLEPDIFHCFLADQSIAKRGINVGLITHKVDTKMTVKSVTVGLTMLAIKTFLTFNYWYVRAACF